MFDINFSGLIRFLLPRNWRRPKQLAWIGLILSALKKIYADFVMFRTKKLYDINFTGQIIYLEHKLNETFNCEGIYISDSGYVQNVYIFNKGEDYLPIYIGKIFVEDIIYAQGDWVVYGNHWYEYLDTGNGDTPDTDISAIDRGEISTMLVVSGFSESLFDFIVNIPDSVHALMSQDDINKLKKIVEYYKLAEMRYTINTY